MKKLLLIIALLVTSSVKQNMYAGITLGGGNTCSDYIMMMQQGIPLNPEQSAWYKANCQ